MPLVCRCQAHYIRTCAEAALNGLTDCQKSLFLPGPQQQLKPYRQTHRIETDRQTQPTKAQIIRHGCVAQNLHIGRYIGIRVGETAHGWRSERNRRCQQSIHR